MRADSPRHSAQLDEDPALSFSASSPLVFGGGLTGLSAGHMLGRAGVSPVVFEADDVVGGLSRTVVSGDFRYDLGGHRFFTTDKEISDYLADLMGDELIRVHRTSKIFLHGRFFDYPLRPSNAVFGLSPLTIFNILRDYCIERLKCLFGLGPRRFVSLEDWVVSNFGRTMFEIYFKQYSEKVWGIGCDRISSSWVARRIQGLSLGKALKNAFFRFSGKDIPTLADSFDYPALGIGRISERLEQEVLNASGQVVKDARLTGLRHEGDRITSAEVRMPTGTRSVSGSHYISTVPLTALVKGLSPEPPAEVRQAAEGLGFRDLLIVAVAADRENVTGESWVYIPEKKYPFGRLHEPRNWSASMAPGGKTLVVVEFFCFEGDDIWNSDDNDLRDVAINGMVELGFMDKSEALWAEVLRVRGAYPLFDVGYAEKVDVIMRYLDRFENLSVAGRGGTFAYLNMDHAIDSGMKAAHEALRKVLGDR